MTKKGVIPNCLGTGLGRDKEAWYQITWGRSSVVTRECGTKLPGGGARPPSPLPFAHEVPPLPLPMALGAYVHACGFGQSPPSLFADEVPPVPPLDDGDDDDDTPKWRREEEEKEKDGANLKRKPNLRVRKNRRNTDKRHREETPRRGPKEKHVGRER